MPSSANTLTEPHRHNVVFIKDRAIYVDQYVQSLPLAVEEKKDGSILPCGKISLQSLLTSLFVYGQLTH